MTIQQVSFDNEKELHAWVERNISNFFGDVIYLPGNFYIYTKRKKGGKPDGFLLDLDNSSWTIIESELISHGVWDHISEQIIRFIVASYSDDTKRLIRDYFFDELERKKQINKASEKLKITPARLMQKIENIVEGRIPDIAIFIDQVNDDLKDMVEALNATIRVFRVQKYLANGNVEYLCPEGKTSTIETSIEEVKDTKGNQAQALEILGGGSFQKNIGNIKFYNLESGERVSIKYSKYYESDQSYWYGITPSTFENYRNENISHLAFILGSEGVVKLPFEILEEYLKITNKTLHPDGSIKHYHVFIKSGSPHKLYVSKNKKKWNVEEHFYSSDE